MKKSNEGCKIVVFMCGGNGIRVDAMNGEKHVE
jgi:hypothetical protein